jgi:hypothetical protein
MWEGTCIAGRGLVQYENCFVEMINRGDSFHDWFHFVDYLFPSDCRNCDCWAAVTGRGEILSVIIVGPSLTSLYGNGRVEVPKELKKFLETSDSVARGRAPSLATSLPAVSFPPVLGEIPVFRGTARCIVA